MTSTQVSFLSFALAQQAASCTPPAAIPDAAPVVAHGLGVGGGGECSMPRVYASWLLTVKWRDGACRSFRYFSRSLARSRARDFPFALSAVVERQLGYMTFSGWVGVDAGAA